MREFDHDAVWVRGVKRADARESPRRFQLPNAAVSEAISSDPEGIKAASPGSSEERATTRGTLPTRALHPSRRSRISCVAQDAHILRRVKMDAAKKPGRMELRFFLKIPRVVAR